MLNDSDANAVPPLQLTDFLPPLSRWVKFGGLLLMGAMGGAIAYAANAHYHITVKAPAIIRPTTAQRPVIQAFVPVEQISQLAIGQSAQIRLTACPYPDYGTLAGRVKTIAPPATPVAPSDQNLGASSFYAVTIEPAQWVLSQNQRQCHVQIGMQGRVDIMTHETTVLRSLLQKVRLITDL
jgi:multidrug efflux pump subunit AcrA (membrane-fusion protein)